MRPWRASWPRSKQSGSMRLGSAPARRRGRRCSSISRCSTIGSACTQPWATAPRLRRGPAWRRSPCVRQHDILIAPLHSKGGGPLDTRGVREGGSPAGYIVVPPSGHISGGRYAWEAAHVDFAQAAVAPPWLVFLATFSRRDREALAERCGITGPDGFGDLPPAQWPERATELLSQVDAAERRERPRMNGGAGASARQHYALAAIERELADFAGTPPGGQENAMNDAALRIWGLIKGAGFETDAERI